MLIARVSLLTRIATENGVEIPPLTTNEQALIEQVCDNLGLSSDQIVPTNHPDTGLVSSQMPMGAFGGHQDSNFVPQPTHDDMGLNLMANGASADQTASAMQPWPDLTGTDGWDRSPSDWSWRILNDFSSLSSINYGLGTDSFIMDPTMGTNPNVVGVQNDQPGSSGSSDDEAETDMVPGLAARLGSLRVVADGRLRYYGTASNNHFLGSSNYREGKVDVQEMQRNASIALENAHLDQDIPADLQAHYINLFFMWHNTCHTPVDETMFHNTLAQHGDGQGEWCSLSLVAAM